MAQQPRSLAGAVVAVTGGGRGIGRATAHALAAAGARVAVGDVDAAAARAAAAALGPDALGLPLDVTAPESFTAFLDAVESALGPLDVLVNNAGIMPVARFVDEDDATTTRLIEINLHGVVIGARDALRRMLPRQRGHLVNVASSAGRVGVPGGATYSATKFGVYGLSEALRAELRGTGVEVSVVMPALVNTELAAGVPRARGVRTVEAEDVAEAIVAALRRPRFDVYVPRWVGGLDKALGLLPRRGREAVSRLLKVDRVLLEADRRARAGYEARAAGSAPAAEERRKAAAAAPTGNGDAGPPRAAVA